MLGLEKRKETRRRLIEAAADEFARHGFANARVRHIVDQAHANLAAVNYHFGGKDALYRATLDALAIRSRKYIPRTESAQTAEERLRRRIQLTLERFLLQQDGAALGRILAHEAMNPTAHLEDVIAQTLKPEIDALVAILGEVRNREGGPDELVFSALGVIGQCLLFEFAGSAIRKACPSLPEGAALCEAAAAHVARAAICALRTSDHFSCKSAEPAL